MQIAKWGNSLAVRLPADVVRQLGLKAGDEIELKRLEDGSIAVISERQRRDMAIERIRSLARPLPDDYRFDRDEANSRGPDPD